MSATTRWVFGVVALATLALSAWYFGFHHTTEYPTITEDLAQYDTLGQSVADDFTTYPLLALNDEYTITDTLKDGVEITYGGQGSTSTPEVGPRPDTASTTFTSPDLQQSLSLQFPKNLSEPLAITLPGGRTFTVTQNDATDYTSALLTNEPADIPTTEEGAADTVLLGDRSGTLAQVLVSSKEVSAAPEPTYLKYTSPDARLTTYYAYQKDQAAGYRNLKHWTIFKDGTGRESQSYTFHNAHLTTNDRGEVEVRYIAPPDEAVKAQVDDSLWARAQAVVAQDLAASIAERAPDLLIPAPYTIDANGTKTTHEWIVTSQNAINPADTSGDYVLSVSFEVPLLGYPIALDPTLQFTAPGVSNAGDVITGEATNNYFGYSLTTGDFNADGKDDLAVGAYGYNSFQGRAYIFYGGSMVSESATGADVTLTGEATDNFFGISLTTGDLNADGKDDLAVGAYGYNSFQGRAYLFYGGSMVSESATGADVTFTGETTNNGFGISLTTGDLNADGKDDLAVGAYGYNSAQGRTYLFYGGSMVSESATGADVTLTGAATGNYFGYSLTTGDLNADGKDDLVVGAYVYNSAQGRTYLFYGGSMVSESATGADVTLTGAATGNYFGYSLTTGDFNADGKDDLAVGAYGYNSSQGRAYLFYGGSMVSESATGADVTLTGAATGNYFGYSLTTGDFNADGKDDLAVGAYGYNSAQGRTYLFYGGSMVSESATGADVTLTGAATGNYFGRSLTTGDFNADGKDDLVVGAYVYNSFQGRSYIFYSQSGQVNLNQHITGEGTSDYFGGAFATGDWNADGREDLAVGAPNDNTNTGKVYIFYNDGSYPTTAATADVTITGGATNNYFGSSLAAGDYNADGRTDLAIGAGGCSSLIGCVYLFYNDGSYPTTAATADVTITGGAIMDFFGSSLAAGDFNADGKTDLAVGAYYYSSGTGRAYLFYNDGSIPTTAATADVTITGGATYNYFGSSLAAGDFNADGKTDLAVGANGYSSGTGHAYLFYNDGSIPTTAATADVTITGGATSNYFGFSLAAGDFNADGKTDLAVGAYGYSTDTGRVYFFYGGSMVSESATGADVTLTGEAVTNYFGYSLTTADLNHDGKEDLVVGAYYYSTNTGRAYVFYNDGSYPTSAASADIIITGDATYDDFGYALAAGDFNMDGREDLVIGAPGYNNNGDTGRLYFYQTRENYAWELQRQSLADGLRVDPLMGYEMKITGEATSNSFGTSIALGDLNNDGKDDLITTGGSKVYIFYNDGNYPTKAGRADVTLTGETASTGFGSALTTGDFNNDSKTDLVVGASGYNSSQGRAYIFYGGSITSESATSADVILTGAATTNTFGAFFGTGDWNIDGKDDLAVGAPFAGKTYVFYGGSMVSESATGADVTLTGEIGSSHFGWSLTTGDWNADGKDDLTIGSLVAGPLFQGRAYIFYGGSIITENASGADVILTGGAMADTFGTSITVGDFNVDGKDDLVVGAVSYNSHQGRAYIFYGGSMISEGTAGADITITGQATDSQFGMSLISGDFNNDGRDDLVVGANVYDVGSGTDDGRAYLFYNDGSIPTTAATADVILTGETANNEYGTTLATGDLNVDGRDDLLVGAIGYNSDQGRLYFYTTNDFQLTGAASGDILGGAMTVGDFNADGKNDLAVGASGYSSNTGRVYIFYGGSYKTETTAGADVILTGGATNNDFGWSLTTGDFNADGKDDLAVGAYRYNSEQGRVYIFYGGTMISENATGADVTLTGEAINNSFGDWSLITGDYNNDGKDDLVVGAIGYNSFQGRTYIFYGGSIITENASGADVILTGEAANNYFGTSLTTGDFNNDGKTDLTVGAYGYNSSQGRTYIFYGGSIITENASGADVILTGEATSNYLGISLTTGDLNNDGKDDLAVGAYGYNSDQGRAYIFFGGSMSLQNASAADVIIAGETVSDSFGWSLTTGDFNDDSKTDLAVGAWGYNSSQGRTYLFYGGSRFVTKSATHADVTVIGEKTNSDFGYFLSSGDLSGNGVDDLIIGASGYDGASSDMGRVYILSSEAATVKYSQHKFQGTVKYQGQGTFH